MKIFISGPISGVADYRERFGDAERGLESKGHIVLNPTKMIPEKLEWDDAMKICEPAVQISDAIFQLPGWEMSAGALRERSVALIARKQVYDSLDEVPEAET